MPEEPTNRGTRFETALEVLDELLPGRVFMDPVFETNLNLFRTKVQRVAEGIGEFANSEAAKHSKHGPCGEWDKMFKRATIIQSHLKDMAGKLEELEVRHAAEVWDRHIGNNLTIVKESVSDSRRDLMVTLAEISSIYAESIAVEVRHFFIRTQQLRILIAMLGALQEAGLEGMPPHAFSREAIADVSLEGAGKLAELLLERCGDLIAGGSLAIDIIKQWRHEKTSADEAIRRVRAFIILHQIVYLWDSGQIQSMTFDSPPEFGQEMDNLHKTMCEKLQMYDALVRHFEDLYSAALRLSAGLSAT